MAKRIDWLKVGAGLALAGLTLADVVPGDELAGVPLGAYLVLDGLKVI